MRILFDHGIPRGLAQLLPEQNVTQARTMGWHALNNGQLLKAAEEAAFEILLTTDQGYSLSAKPCWTEICHIVLTGTTKWSRVRLHAERISAAVKSAGSGTYTEIFVPFDSA